MGGRRTGKREQLVELLTFSYAESTLKADLASPLTLPSLDSSRDGLMDLQLPWASIYPRGRNWSFFRGQGKWTNPIKENRQKSLESSALTLLATQKVLILRRARDGIEQGIDYID